MVSFPYNQHVSCHNEEELLNFESECWEKFPKKKGTSEDVPELII